MSFRSLLADLVLGGNLGNLYSLTGTITIGDPNFGHIVLDGGSDAILIYQAAHSLTLSIAPAAGVDPNGVHYPAGVAWFDPASQTVVASWDEADGFALNGSTNGQSIAVTSAPTKYASGGAPAGTTSAFVRALSSYLITGLPAMDAVVVGGPTSPVSIDSDLSSVALALSQGQGVDGAVGALQFLSRTVTAALAQFDKTGFNIKAGSVTAPAPGGTIGQSETWHTVPLASISALWTNVGVSQPLRYRLEGVGGGLVRLSGELLTTGAGPWPGGGTITTLPVNYRPAQGTPFITRSDIAVAAGQNTVNVVNNGMVQNGQNFTAASQRLFFDGIAFPVD